MRLIYVSGAYRAPTVRRVVENIRRAEEVALAFWRAGWAAFCPHLNTALFDGAAPDETWLAGDLEILRRCDAICMLPGWEHSAGAAAEKQQAEQDGLAVYYWEDLAGTAPTPPPSKIRDQHLPDCRPMPYAPCSCDQVLECRRRARK